MGKKGHIAYVEVDFDDLSTRTAVCTCGWKGPERTTLELAVDDALIHEESDMQVVQKR